MRVGMGYDVHKLTENRDLILGGVKIPWEKGLLGHSDADVLIHAVMDALLGAAALGDIGKHFPDTDPKYKGISSVKLLIHVSELLKEHGYEVGNIDATIIAQKPKMAPHIPQMRKNMADALGIPESKINVKATTEEGLGFTGSRGGDFFSGNLPAHRDPGLILLQNNIGGKRHEDFLIQCHEEKKNLYRWKRERYACMYADRLCTT